MVLLHSIAWAERNAKLMAGDGELVVGKQGRPANALPVHARAVGASQVAQEEQAVRFDDDTVHLGNTLMVQAQVAIFPAADERQVFDDLNRRRAIERNQLGAHG